MRSGILAQHPPPPIFGLEGVSAVSSHDMGKPHDMGKHAPTTSRGGMAARLGTPGEPEINLAKTKHTLRLPPTRS